MLFDHAALERARNDAGLLPSDLARQMRSSVDTITAIIERGTDDHNLTLADLRRLATAVALAPRDLLRDSASNKPSRRAYAQLAALLHRDGTSSIEALAARLGRTPDEILDAVDAYNHDAKHGLKITRRHHDLALVSDPTIKLPERPATYRAPKAAHTDHLLWQVIDRALPETPPADTTSRLQAMADQGLVAIFDGQWRPSDAVIEALDLLDWDTRELIDYARDLPAHTSTTT